MKGRRLGGSKLYSRGKGRMHVYIAEHARPVGAHVVGTIDGELSGDTCVVHFIYQDRGIIGSGCNASALSSGSWGSIKRRLTPGSPDIDGIRAYVRHAADASFLEEMWDDLDCMADDGPLCVLYGMTANVVRQRILAVLANLPPLDGSYEWICEVHSHRAHRVRPDAKNESQLIKQTMASWSGQGASQKMCSDLFKELLVVELVVATVHDVLRVPLIKQLYVMPSSLIRHRCDMPIGLGLYSARALKKGEAVTQYDGVLTGTPNTPSKETSHHMGVQFGHTCIAGVSSVQGAVGQGGLSFANTCARAGTNLVRHNADALSKAIFGECHVPRVVIAYARCDIAAHSELFMHYHISPLCSETPIATC